MHESAQHDHDTDSPQITTVTNRDHHAHISESPCITWKFILTPAVNFKIRECQLAPSYRLRGRSGFLCFYLAFDLTTS